MSIQPTPLQPLWPFPAVRPPHTQTWRFCCKPWTPKRTWCSAINAFITELMERLHKKLLPATPETRDGSELFALALSDDGDAQWIAALPVPLLARLARLLTLPTSTPIASTLRPLTCWQNALLEACTFCTSQIRAASFSPDLRLRMSATTRESSHFMP